MPGCDFGPGTFFCRKLLIAKELVDTVSTKLGVEEGDAFRVVQTLSGKDLVGIK